MPRRRPSPEETKRFGQYGDWWLEKYRDRRYWHRVRYNQEKGTNEYVSLKIADARAAQDALIAFVNAQQESDAKKNKPKRVPDPSEVKLHEVLDWHWENHLKTLNSTDTPKIAVRYWKSHFSSETTLADLVPVAIKGFGNQILANGGSLGYADRIIGIGRSAVYAARDNLLVNAVPKIRSPQTQLDRDEVPPRGRPLEIPELAKLLRAQSSHHMLVFMAIMMNTLCRPDAALDLAKAQVDFDRDRVDLNPPGRRQTKKYRPIVPLTPTLKRILLGVEELGMKRAQTLGDHAFKFSHYVTYGGQSLNTVKTGFRHMVEKAGFVEEDGEREPITPYSIRHTLARVLRGSMVPTEEISIYLGHKPKGSSRTTSIYAPYSPEYCATAAAVVEDFVNKVGLEVARQDAEETSERLPSVA